LVTLWRVATLTTATPATATITACACRFVGAAFSGFRTEAGVQVARFLGAGFAAVAAFTAFTTA
jgi:hypothetical protein